MFDLLDENLEFNIHQNSFKYNFITSIFGSVVKISKNKKRLILFVYYFLYDES